MRLSLSRKELVQKIIITLMLSVSLFLVLTVHYLSASSIEETSFGLQGASVKGHYFKYSTLVSTCDSFHTLADYCSYLNSLKTAGSILTVFLVLDIVVLLSFMGFSVLLQLSISNIASKILENTDYAVWSKILGKVALFGRLVIFLHPIFCLLGAVLWMEQGEIAQMDGVQIEIGLIALILQVFLSLVCAAYSLWHFSRVQRFNLRFVVKEKLMEKVSESGVSKV